MIPAFSPGCRGERGHLLGSPARDPQLSPPGHGNQCCAQSIFWRRGKSKHGAVWQFSVGRQGLPRGLCTPVGSDQLVGYQGCM